MITDTGITGTGTTSTGMADGQDGDLGPSAGGAGPPPDADADGALLDLMVWLSPAFPVGGFTYSHGLEWAIEDGSVASAAGLEAWLADVLRHGAGRTDAILFTEAHAAASRGDAARLGEVVDLAAALQPTRERRLEATAQGTAFLTAIRDTWPQARLDALLDDLGRRGHAPVFTHATAVATVAAVHGVAARPAGLAYLQAFAATVISAGVRTIPLGQTDGLRILKALGPLVRALVDEAATAGLDGVGGVALRADIASMKHETQYTRLYRS